MQTKRVRVVVGSDGASARDVLAGLVEKQSGVVVGQAVNAPEAITLTRNLRPDVVILDCHLPHTRGLLQIPLSRAGGLDAAQFISDEIPGTRVLVVVNLDSPPPIEMLSSPEVAVSLHRDQGMFAGAPLSLNNLLANGEERTPIFARLFLKKLVTRGKLVRVAEEVTLFGMVGVLLGLIMMVTGILFVPGVAMAGLGGVAALLGFGAKTVLNSFKRGKTNESET